MGDSRNAESGSYAFFARLGVLDPVGSSVSISAIGSRVGRPSYEYSRSRPLGGERDVEVEDEADNAGDGDLVERVVTPRLLTSLSTLACESTGGSVLADIPAVGPVDVFAAPGDGMVPEALPTDARGFIPEPAVPQLFEMLLPVAADGERERERELLREEALVTVFKAVRDGLGDMVGE